MSQARTEVKWYGDELLKQLRQHVPDALFAVAEAFVEDAASRAPRRKGTLAASGYVKSNSKSTYRKHKLHRKEAKLPDDDTVLAGFAAFYAGWVERGTGSRPAQPFVRPALDALQGRAGSILQAKLGGKLK